LGVRRPFPPNITRSGHLGYTQAAVHLHRLNQDLHRLRQYRNLPERDLTLSAPLGELCRTLERQARSAGGMGEAWAATVPAHLAAGCQVVSFSRGVLTVRAADSAVRFQVDRFLRGGGEAALAQAAGTALKRVRVL
jgi:hypothetical protein